MSFLRGLGRIACLHPSFPDGKQIRSDCTHIEVKHSPRVTAKTQQQHRAPAEDPRQLYPLQGQDGNGIPQEFQSTAMFSGKILGGL